eukprot:TRINITY_DN46455_c0_g1_i1.p1 TRINITY_DN46455_c0_g1~~TRINITY_DN46455_c0_g1_i1.p1  ORF type:complete len:107 (-),score=7.59 TRINITY_DN46455_c0_g1_i1:123-443(-)
MLHQAAALKTTKACMRDQHTVYPTDKGCQWELSMRPRAITPSRHLVFAVYDTDCSGHTAEAVCCTRLQHSRRQKHVCETSTLSTPQIRDASGNCRCDPGLSPPADI